MLNVECWIDADMCSKNSLVLALAAFTIRYFIYLFIFFFFFAAFLLLGPLYTYILLLLFSIQFGFLCALRPPMPNIKFFFSSFEWGSRDNPISVNGILPFIIGFTLNVDGQWWWWWCEIYSLSLYTKWIRFIIHVAIKSVAVDLIFFFQNLLSLTLCALISHTLVVVVSRFPIELLLRLLVSLDDFNAI